jgi:hypothetical protein
MGASTGLPLEGAGHSIANIKGISDACKVHGLTTSYQLAADLFAPILRELLEGQPKANGRVTALSGRLTAEQATKLREAAGRIRDTVMAESKNLMVYVASDKRFALSYLLDDIGGLMDEGVFDELPDVSKYDFQQAGKSIAFELPTAAAYHLLRGTEGVLKHFYLSIVKQRRLNNPMWNPMVIALRNRSKPPPKVLLDSVDNIRVNFRNPTQHPEMVYDIGEVQNLMPLCFDATNRMMKYLRVSQT